LFVSPTNVVGQTTAPRLAARSEPIYLIVRSDDGGMSDRVNMIRDNPQYAAAPPSKGDSASRSLRTGS
jgi:hypothetical protein